LGSTTVDGGIPFAVNRVVGPKEDLFIFDDSVATTDRVWSQCGVKRTLTVRTRVDLTNSNPRRSGEFNVHALDGTTQTKLVISFAKQTCTP
jgi:hypothetical protein